MAKAKRQRNPPQVGFHRWKPGTRFPVKASVAAAALERIRVRDGAVTPAAVVEDARSTRHPLHKCFTWDDDLAAERWRQQQARMLINSVRVLVQSGEHDAVQQVAFISVVARESGRVYLPASVVMADADYQARALAEALAALQGWQRRYRHLTALSGVFAAIQNAVPKTKRKRAA